MDLFPSGFSKQIYEVYMSNIFNKIKKSAENSMADLSLKTKLSKSDEVVLLPLSIINRDVEPFKSLNPVDEAQRSRLEESFKKNGMLKSNPLILWRRKLGKKTDYVLTEGFSRSAVCERLGITEVWCIIRDYANSEEAEKAARFQEFSRRHDDSKALYRHFLALDLETLKKEPGRTNELVAKQLGISPSSAQKLIQIKAAASSEIQEKLKEGEISTDAAFNSITKKQNPNKTKISASAQKYMDGVRFALESIKAGKSENEILQAAEKLILG